MIAYGPPMRDFAVGEEHDNGNGTISIKRPNGRWLCVTPAGAVDERDTPGGVWESFVRGDTGYIAQREGPNHEIVVCVLAYVKA